VRYGDGVGLGGGEFFTACDERVNFTCVYAPLVLSINRLTAVKITMSLFYVCVHVPLVMSINRSAAVKVTMNELILYVCSHPTGHVHNKN
jgi:hypothetical protein